MPAFYPNVVTLTPDADGATLAALSGLALPGRWGVKDSFATLDLASRGFDLLMEARWIHREARDPSPVAREAWRTVRTPVELEAWEAAWAGLPGGVRPEVRVFPPALLGEEGVVFLATGDAARPDAGGIASLSAGVVGLSNTFLSENVPASRYAELLSQLQVLFPGRPVVGYEHGEALDVWRSLGFESGDPLRVWLKQEG
ncbi:hypothetical protein D7Y13_16825 [Corallococcus praedator]|uniref:GNAT family N-acetyltransferase n=1 Tax=Corallococcus praedator TaxID=2316724 RepID=A0ABX9QHA4_9BACT|nr:MULTISPECIES: hypothetical protein [Corallococcus]RKH28252.1 hypothetical protein D7X75_25030 [Corallococcus sp. CA031C]RKI07984.1 hypothetical protein D7Y13_16825 [Corallococcus praedator]